MATHQFFALDSTATGYAAAIAKLATDTSTNRSYTVTQVLRSASHDASIKIVCAYVDESDLTGDTADLAAGVYPTELCRHRWKTLDGFRTSGFHMLGESVRSYEGVAGRVAVHVRPQTGPTEGNPGLPTGDGYGDGTGATDYDAANGPQDNAALGGGATHLYETGKSYFYKDGAFVRYGNMGPGGNSPYGNGGSNQGMLAVEDATGLGDAGKINFYYCSDSPLGPGLFWGSYTLWEQHSDLPWEEFGAGSGIYVNGQFQEAGSGQNVGQTAVLHDADVDDITVDADTLTKRHHLKGQTALANLNGTTGRGRCYVQTSGGIGEGNWDAVLFNDGAGNWADLTAAANDATVDDFELMPAGAANGAYIAFIRAAEFPGCMTLNLSQNLVGGTVVPGYSKGSGDVTGTFTNIVDPTNGLTATTTNQEIAFNPKADWAADTFAAGEAFEIAGYAFVFRKTAGTVTTAARGDQTQARARACFIHRWNDGAPTRGPCHAGPSGATFNAGLRHDLNAQDNYEYVSARLSTGGMWGEMQGCNGVIFSGCQLLPYADLQLGASNMTATFRASQTDKAQAVWWAITDMRVQDKTDTLIQEVLAYVTSLGGDTTKFDNMGEWSDICYCINGLYPGVSGGRWNPLVIQGLRIRKVGMMLDLMNDTDAINLYVNEDPTDHHSFAMRGDQDADTFTIEQLGFEDFLRAVETYAPATGNNDAPVSGSASGCKNWRFHYGYHHTHNGNVDSGQPAGAFVFSGDNDRGKYEDGTGGDSGNEVKYWGFKDINNETDAAGSGISNSAEEVVTARGCVFDGVRWPVSLGRSGGPDSCNTITETTGPTYNDITANVMDSGNTATALFASGAAGNILNLGVSVRVLRRFGFTITTAGVGAPTLAWEYRRASDWAAVTNLSDGTSGLTATGTVTFDRPTDAATLDINGKTCWWVRCRIVSGSFSTIPQANEISSRTIGASIDIQHYTVKNIVKGIIRNITNDFGNNSAVIIDDHAVIELSGAQTTDTDFYKIGSTSQDTPDQTLAEWQARSKSKTDTAAESDCVFGTNHSMS